jgi:hypothetical protein
MPVREKKIKKLGTIKPNYVESTPFVWNDELMIFEWIRADSWAHNGNEIGCYHIVNLEKNIEYKPFGFDHAFGSAYEEGGTVHISGRCDNSYNVQSVLEQMGGGGHRAAAGAQLKETSLQEAYETLVGLIRGEQEKGE